MMPVALDIAEEIRDRVRDVPDFPAPGILFRDITPLFYDQKFCTRVVTAFCGQLTAKPDAVLGIESRGFLFGLMVANRLDVPFVLVRKAGKLPYRTIRHEYALEYGKATMEIHEDALRKGWRVLIHDDLLATGGTAEAAACLVEKLGASVEAFNFVIGLDALNGTQKLIKHTKNITCLAHY